jgi:proteasome lid subunit RPN8/RPN11
MDPAEQTQAMFDLEAGDLQMLAIYHSHPYTPAFPSGTDVSQAYYPDAAQVIVSWVEPDRPQARAFTIIDGIVAEIDLKIE